MNPVILHVVRPYDTVEEYLSAEAWTIEPRSVSLLGARELPPDTPVVFDLGISVGDKLMRAEGRVAAFFPATDDHPSVLRVRYKRYGSQTKSFIERAVTIREEQLAREASNLSSAPPPAEQPSAEPTPIAPEPALPKPDPLASAASEHVADAAPPRAMLASVPPAPMQPVPARDALDVRSEPRAHEPSGIHRRAVVPVPAPENREELLDRLRARSRSSAAALDRTKTGAE